jgi:nucleoside-triphosphatase
LNVEHLLSAFQFFSVSAFVKLLITGRPGSGKTTLIKRVAEKLPQPAGGFYTEEIREHGTRVGFKIVTLDGKEAVLAHVDFTGPERVSKYGLDLRALKDVGVKSINLALKTHRCVVIDEIGPMEIRSAAFREAVIEVLDSDVPLLATIFARPLPFTDKLKRRRDVTLIELRPDNRAKLASELADKFSHSEL